MALQLLSAIFWAIVIGKGFLSLERKYTGVV
jgi:hypothetical protein